MKLLVVDNIHLIRSPSGKYYSKVIYDNEFWQRYLNVFDRVRIVGKVKQVEYEPTNMSEISNPRIEVYGLTWYRGIKEMVKKLPAVLKDYRDIFTGCDACILRVVQIESIFAYLFGSIKRYFYVEVVNDPLTLDRRNFLVRFISVYFMKLFCMNAKGVAYITDHILQNKYPCSAMLSKSEYFTASYPTIDLSNSEIFHAKTWPSKLHELRILHVANIISGDGKGHKTLIAALKIAVEAGCNAYVKFIGEGDDIERFVSFAKELGIADRVLFVGRVSGHAAVLDEMRNSDLFVFPSKSEGQGRVNIEAMASGLPCIASNVGGIPELFPSEYLFEPSDVKGFGEMIIKLYNAPMILSNMSTENVCNARRFLKEAVIPKRNEFYERIRRDSLTTASRRK